jgi:archaellum component FlaC
MRTSSKAVNELRLVAPRSREIRRGGDTPMTLQDVEEQINTLQAEIEGLKETIEEVTTGLYTLVGQLITR